MAKINYGNLTNFRQELAVLQESINKYNPPAKVKFTIPALMGDLKIEQSTPSRSNNILNKTNDLGITRTTTSKYISLPIPEEFISNYPEKYVPEGTMFIVGFIGGDITSARIIGRYW